MSGSGQTRPDSWHFAYAADIHVGTPRSYRFRPTWNRRWQAARPQIVAAAPEFLVLGGDLTRDGATHRFELEQVKAELDKLPFPVYAVPGNHETGNKKLPADYPDPAAQSVGIQPEYLELYASVFGPSHWSFVHRDVRFSGFNPFLAGSGLPAEAEFWAWFEAQAAEPRAKSHVWFMHAALFCDDLHEPNWDVREDRAAWYFGIDQPHRSRMLDVFKATGAQLVISGHIHCRRVVEAEGITFYFAPATAFPQWDKRWPGGDPALGWLNCEVAGGSVTPRFVPLQETIADAEFYGPGGNPPLAGRDYSAAWETPALDIAEQRFPRKIEPGSASGSTPYG